ncbi:glutathione S-transferase family protein [Phenylobacterium sp. 58.2.17]|uniref:glutathione S-transferase family protein n=1 Tax=Phenylobacterium sp. 58.2.17 TaxID=2969306 RepID=UPI0022643192|nr:glutathione S-transferase N-terminal domain-containing protein [Phenylobacterium sp. 58.2.17]MCX7585332.1 glutathione S-transferase N-terminal domain-containing protein [Phenylobacterium sp. 58.2.17]
MLRLHHAPMACSLASRFALAEAGLAHEVAVVRTARGENRTEAYLRVNPRGKVPALETDQGVITESTAILPFIADLAPEAGLLPPPGTFARAQAQAWLSFLSSTVHGAYTGALRPEAFDGCDAAAVRAVHVARIGAALQEVDAHLASREHLLDAFSVCDLYLLVFLLWRGAPAVAGKLPALANLDAYQQRMLARPALAAILGEEMKLMAEG